MGTREVYEEKHRSGNLYHDPTINPGLGSARCPRRRVNEPYFGIARCDYRGIPYLQSHLKGPKWLPFVVGLPALLVFSGASAAFGGYVLPKFAQLTATSYYTVSSASHYGISLLNRHVEESHASRTQKER